MHIIIYYNMRISPTAQLYDTFLHTRLDWTCEVGTSKMSLLKYFTKQKTTPLPDPSGALSREVPSSAIASANNEVQKIASSSTSSESKKRGPYSKSFSPQVKAEIGAENGVTSTLRRYVSKYPDLKQSTVRIGGVALSQGRSSKIKTRKTSKSHIRENCYPRKFPAIRYLILLLILCY